MKPHPTFRIRTRSGFSLVEVTLALGIVAFAMTILLALLGTALDTGGEVTDRREAYQSIDALRQYLADEVEFDDAYEWAKVQTGQPLVYVSYRVDANGAPDTDGRAVRSKWLDPADNPVYPDYEAAREGSWIKARLRLDDVQNPIDQANLQSDADDYPHAYLVFQVEVYEVGAPDLPTEPWAVGTDPDSPPPPKPFFTAPVVARR